MTFSWPARIRFSDTDASTRIHYSAIFRHFEAAEEEFLRFLGFGYSHPVAYEGIAWPRVHAECDISAALWHDDKVDIEVGVEKVGNRSFELAFRILKEGRECATGKVVVVCMDKRTQRARPLPEDFAAALRNQLPR